MAYQKQLAIMAATLILSLAIVAQQASAWWLFSSEQQKPTSVPETVANYSARQEQEMRAIAQFDLDGVKGAFKFSQKSPQEPTRVEYDLRGLKGNNRLYHVHVRPVPEHNHEQAKRNSTLIGQLCSDPTTGGHLNPFKITQKLPPKSAPFDRYELGDLSGKHGPLLELAGHPDHYVGGYTDDRLPMFGEHSIVGRSIVIHKNDGTRWVCATIVPGY